MKLILLFTMFFAPVLCNAESLTFLFESNGDILYLVDDSVEKKKASDQDAVNFQTKFETRGVSSYSYYSAYCEPSRDTGKILAVRIWSLKKDMASGEIRKDMDRVTYNYDLGSGFANTIQRVCRN